MRILIAMKKPKESVKASEVNHETRQYCVTIGTNDEHGERDLRNSSLAFVPSNYGPYVIPRNVMAKKR